MADEKIGIIRAFFRYFRMWNWKQARGIIKAADEQFTGSVDGIDAAFDIYKDKMVNQYQGLRDAVAEVEAILEDKRQRLDALNEEEKDLMEKRDGALHKAEEAQASNDTDALDRHSAAFERFQVRIDEIEALQEKLNSDIQENTKSLNQYMLQLSEFQAEIEKLPQQKAEAMAEFVSAQKIIELNDRLQGLESSLDRGPISAVMEANKKLSAKARISQKLAGTDVRLQDKEYERAGRQSTARSKMEQMLAARRIEKQQEGATEAPVTDKEDDRPKI